jgi:hypothetical protein
VEEYQRLLGRLMGGRLAKLLTEIDRHANGAVISLSSARRARDSDGSPDR